MRPNLPILLLTLLLGTLAWAEPETAVLHLEGRVQPAGPSIYMEGSHELVDAKGQLIARLSGAQNEISLADVEGQWVRLGGAWRPTVEAGGRIFEVSEVGEPTACDD